jgi:hypothetical protein
VIFQKNKEKFYFPNNTELFLRQEQNKGDLFVLMIFLIQFKEICSEIKKFEWFLSKNTSCPPWKLNGYYW